MPHTPIMASRGDDVGPYDIFLELAAKFIDEAETVGDTSPLCLNVCSSSVKISLKAARLLKEEKYVDSAEHWRNKLFELSRAIGTEFDWIDDQIRSTDRQIATIRKKSNLSAKSAEAQQGSSQSNDAAAFRGQQHQEGN